MNPIKTALVVLFAPTRFESQAIDYALQHEAGLNASFRKQLESGQLSQETKEKYGRVARGQVRALRRVAASSFLLCALTIVAGYASGCALHLSVGAPAKWAVYVIQAIGASAILGATTSAEPRELETIDRDSLPERIHEAFFRGLVALGTFVFVLSVSWDS